MITQNHFFVFFFNLKKYVLLSIWQTCAYNYTQKIVLFWLKTELYLEVQIVGHNQLHKVLMSNNLLPIKYELSITLEKGNILFVKYFFASRIKFSTTCFAFACRAETVLVWDRLTFQCMSIHDGSTRKYNSHGTDYQHKMTFRVPLDAWTVRSLREFGMMFEGSF